MDGRTVKVTMVLCITLLLYTVMHGGGRRAEHGHHYMSNLISLFFRLRGPLEYDEPRLIELIRRRYLTPPSIQPYNLTRVRNGYEAALYNAYLSLDPAYLPLQTLIMQVFDGVKDGFFVEAGALDGEFLSNTLELEKRGWAGLLVEADGDSFQHLLTKHRKAWSVHACLAPKTYADSELFIKHRAHFTTHPAIRLYSWGHSVLASHVEVSPGHTVDGKEKKNEVEMVYEQVQCLPFASLLLALNKTHVQFVSLDIEGAEMDVLRNFPWDKIRVDAWLVEHIVSNNALTKSALNPAHISSLLPQTLKPFAAHTNGKTNKHLTHIVSITPDTTGFDQKELDIPFIDFFFERGYVLYPMNVHESLDNYLFVHKNSGLIKKNMKRGVGV